MGDHCFCEGTTALSQYVSLCSLCPFFHMLHGPRSGGGVDKDVPLGGEYLQPLIFQHLDQLGFCALATVHYKKEFL